MAQPRNATKMPFRLHPDQKAALYRLAEQRGVNASSILREAVADITGVPDRLQSMRRFRAHSHRPGSRTTPQPK